MLRCIYCGADQVSQEHYFPRALGRFDGFEGLNDRVCGECNNSTTQAEQVLLRTGEIGFFRERYRVRGRKRDKTAESPFYQWMKGVPPLTATVFSPEFGHDVLMEITMGGEPTFARQMVLDRDGKKTCVAVPKDCRTAEDLVRLVDKVGLRGASLAGIIGSREDMAWMGAATAGFVPPGPPDRHAAMDVERLKKETFKLKGKLTEFHARAVAKIAFHYVLKHLGRHYRGDELAFEPLRRFIRQGGNPDQFVQIQRSHRLTPVRPHYDEEPVGHLVMAASDQGVVQVRIHFFGSSGWTPWTWIVLLGREPNLIIAPRKCAHAFEYYVDGDFVRKDVRGFDGRMVEAVAVVGPHPARVTKPAGR
jgi:hypothetical protein